MAPNSDTPPNRLADKHTFLGLSFSLIAYGISMVLFLRAVYILLYRRKAPHHRKTTIALLTYLCITFALLTACIISNIFIKTRALIDFREYPGGPTAYLKATHFKPASATMIITAFFVNYLTEGLLLYRCYIIYRDKPKFLCIPIIPYCATAGLGFAFIYMRFHPYKAPWDAAKIGLPYSIVSTSSNAILTGLIVIRLLLHRRRINEICPTHTYGRVYLTASAIFIESCALNTVTSMFFLIPHCIGNPWSYLVFNTWPDVRFMASCLLIYRMAKQRAWNRRMVEQFSARPPAQFSSVIMETAAIS